MLDVNKEAAVSNTKNGIQNRMLNSVLMSIMFSKTVFVTLRNNMCRR